MKGSGSSPPLMNLMEDEEEGRRIAREVLEGERGRGENEDTRKHGHCLILGKPGSNKRGEEMSSGKHTWWKQESKTKATTLEKQLQAKWKSEELIEEQLNRFLGLYSCNAAPTRLKDVSDLLVPEHVPPHELATLTWLGDWRPSMILELARELSGCLSSPMSSRLSTFNDVEQKLSQIIHDIRIEEAVIDSEMAEIQSTCVFYLQFAPANNRRSYNADRYESIQTELKKIKRVITKAQHLRCKALQWVVKKVLDQTEAAEFLVAFAGIQNMIRLSALSLKPKDVAVPPPVTLDQVKLPSSK